MPVADVTSSVQRGWPRRRMASVISYFISDDPESWNILAALFLFFFFKNFIAWLFHLLNSDSLRVLCCFQGATEEEEKERG